jgi:Zn-dependent protease
MEPARTPWDLQFNVAGIPVRVHPMFWLMSLIIGGVQTTGIKLVLGVLIVFVSILVHELGHAFTMIYFRERARVVLYWLGGLAISGGDGPWDVGYGKGARSPREQIIISLAGPAAGFALAAIVAAIVYGIGGHIVVYRSGVLPGIDIDLPRGLAISSVAEFSLRYLLWINTVWGVMNLLPVFPLDGGQVARQVFILRNPYDGVKQSLWLSLIVGAVLAVAGLSGKDFWIAILFGSLAFGSWQMLQSSGYGGRRW